MPSVHICAGPPEILPKGGHGQEARGECFAQLVVPLFIPQILRRPITYYLRQTVFNSYNRIYKPFTLNIARYWISECSCGYYVLFLLASEESLSLVETRAFVLILNGGPHFGRCRVLSSRTRLVFGAADGNNFHAIS